MPESSRLSVCPVCLETVPAQREQNGDDIVLVTHCPDHGKSSAVIWRGEPALEQWQRPKKPSHPRLPLTEQEHGCPRDCGLCPSHGQHTCTAVVEITQRCNLVCPVCYASTNSTAASPAPDPGLNRIEAMLESVRKASGQCNIQFSGGEPSLRRDLPELIGMAKRMDFPFVQLNTNGLMAARDPAFASRMADAGLDSVFFQFDGTTDAVFRTLRGQALLDEKMLALKRFIKAGIGVVLVATVVPGVNDHQLGDLLRLATEYSPGIRGLHFQPVSYFGRYPDAPTPTDDQRITLPEIMRGLERQTSKQVHATDFLPPGCEHSLCSFHANYLVEESGNLRLLSANKAGCGCTSNTDAPVANDRQEPLLLAEEGANQAKAFVGRQWAAPATAKPLLEPMDDLDRFIARASTHILAVSAMAFQDVWTVDIERLQGCCIHIVTRDGRLVPFCAYNMTSASGEGLHRRKGNAQLDA